MPRKTVNKGKRSNASKPGASKRPMPPWFAAVASREFNRLMYHILGDGSKSVSGETIRAAVEEDKLAERILDPTMECPENRRAKLINQIQEQVVNLALQLQSDPDAFKAFQYCRTMEAVIPKDAYLTMLRNRAGILEARGISSTLSAIDSLQHLHMQALLKPELVHPLDAQNALLLAGELGVPAPPWAVSKCMKVRESKLHDPSIDLDNVFGFTANGSGNPSEVERRLREKIQDESMLQIWGLVLLNTPIGQACWLEAGRRQQEIEWKQTGYDVVPDLWSHKTNRDARDHELHDKRLAFTEQLRKKFFKWRTEIEKDPSSYESNRTREYLLANREAFMAQFETVSQ